MKTRLHPTGADDAVLREVGAYLGRLLRGDVAARCRLGDGPKHKGRAERKRALTALSSSRWAGAITRRSDDMWERGFKNLEDLASRDRAEIARIDRRLAAANAVEGGRAPKGYASRAERFEKKRRSGRLAARLADTEQRLAEGRVSITVGGRKLARQRRNLKAAGITEEQWRERWNAKRMFLSADGESGKKGGNETIRVMPDPSSGDGGCIVTLRLPEPLAHMSNTHAKAPAYRLAAPIRWNHLADEWEAQAVADRPVAYTIDLDPDSGNWHISASWSLPPAQDSPTLPEAASSGRVLAVDVNSGDLSARILDRHGNPVGRPAKETIPEEGPAAHRLGAAREAVHRLVKWGIDNGATAGAIEKLDFADARALGRQKYRRGKPGRTTRRKVAGIPTAKLSHAFASAFHRHNMPLIAVDPAYTSKWGSRYWHQPLNQSRRQRGDRHQAAAVVIGRRSQGHSEKRENGKPRHRPEDRPQKAAAQQTADTTGMAPATNNDEREHPRAAVTARADP